MASFAAKTARNAEEAWEHIRVGAVDIVLLDINMPGMGGMEAHRRIRAAAPQAGIVTLTVCDTADDKVIALEAGTDDYVTKPFHLRELVARIQAPLRRTGGEGTPPAAVLRAGDLELHLEQHTLRKGGRSTVVAGAGAKVTFAGSI
jgi:two-component system OmpR family response regulator